MTPPVVACTWTGEGEAIELLTLGRAASEALGTDLVWLLIGGMPDDAAETAKRYGATRIDQIENERVTGGEPDASVEALSQYCAQKTPAIMLFSQTFDVRLIAPRLAGRLRAPVVMNALALEIGDPMRVTASAYGGDTRAVYEINRDGTAIVWLADDQWKRPELLSRR